MCAFGGHLRIKVIDAKRWTCNFGIWCTFKESKGFFYYVGVLKEVIELEFKSLAKEIVLKFVGSNKRCNGMIVYFHFLIQPQMFDWLTIQPFAILIIVGKKVFGPNFFEFELKICPLRLS
jgi:hypothetical protein